MQILASFPFLLSAERIAYQPVLAQETKSVVGGVFFKVENGKLKVDKRIT
jgi:hypothetical protein